MSPYSTTSVGAGVRGTVGQGAAWHSQMEFLDFVYNWYVQRAKETDEPQTHIL